MLVENVYLAMKAVTLFRKGTKLLYRIVGMFGGDKVWRITSSKVVGEKKFGKCLQQRCVAFIIIIMKWTDE